jgi:hypothetical protein
MEKANEFDYRGSLAIPVNHLLAVWGRKVQAQIAGGRHPASRADGMIALSIRQKFHSILIPSGYSFERLRILEIDSRERRVKGPRKSLASDSTPLWKASTYMMLNSRKIQTRYSSTPSAGSVQLWS